MVMRFENYCILYIFCILHSFPTILELGTSGSHLRLFRYFFPVHIKANLYQFESCH